MKLASKMLAVMMMLGYLCGATLAMAANGYGPGDGTCTKPAPKDGTGYGKKGR